MYMLRVPILALLSTSLTDLPFKFDQFDSQRRTPMKIEKLHFTETSGWTDEFPTEMDSPQTLVMVFGASEYIDKPKPIEELRVKFPQSHLVGCSDAGSINDAVMSDGSLAITFIRFEKTQLRTAFSPVVDSSESFSAGEEVARTLNDSDLKGVIILSDGLNVNGTELASGINTALSSEVVVTGGLAADDDRFEKTWVLKDGKPARNYVSAVGLYGSNVRIGYGSKDGLDIFGIERKVTKSHKNQLFELDGQPALDLYKRYLGDRAADLPSSALHFPLSLRVGIGDDNRVVRTVLNIDEASQSMTFAGDVPQGSLAQLMRANVDRLIDGASEAAGIAMRRVSTKNAVLCLAISCVGRRWVLGERTEEELEAVFDWMPEGSSQIGFYSYGEMSPHTKGFCDLHNQTMTLTTIFED